MIYTINIQNFVLQKRIQTALAIPSYIIGNWGFYLLYNPKLSEWKDEYQKGNIWTNPNKEMHTKRA